MKNQLLILLAWLGWIVLAYLVAYQIFDYFKLRDTVRMFTAEQGKELCLRVQTLEEDKMIIKPCE